MSPQLAPGLVHEWTYRVPERAVVPRMYDIDLAADMPPVLATGYLVGIMEFACLKAIVPHLDWPREQTLGTHVSFSHLAATPIGMTVTVKVELVAVDGRRLTFRVEAWDEREKISEGTHERTVIDVARFDARVARKRDEAGLPPSDPR